ncbi:MAG: hypothetical protein JO348_15825 [Alphaproteobacteria bacterium]|nr:hypothetical protein [Alphaproteobacteria bacterium]MBV9421237.1 hypothetical protein [Alphaproteobacteria bacterium]
MKLRCAFGISLLLSAAPVAAPAEAQVYPGQEVTVNPGAIGHGYLLYPGGKYGRNVGVLRQPGDVRGPIHLHMPVKHPVARHVPRRAPPSNVALDAAPPVTAPPAPPPPRRTAPPRTVAPSSNVAVATPPAYTSDVSALPENSAARLVGAETAAPPPKPNRPTPAKPPKQAAHAPSPPPPAAATGDASIPFTLGGPMSAPPRRTASTTPPPARTAPSVPAQTGMRRQSQIPFAPGQSSPANADVAAVHSLAASLNAALNAGATRVQLEAYGGPRGDKSSDSRRLSLKRALVIRELLIEDGVPSEKIDVRAMGGVDDSGAADRVDVFVRT